MYDRLTATRGLRDGPDEGPEDRRRAEAEDEPLPFDPRTLAWRLARRWPLYVNATYVGCALGVLCALMMGSRTYEAETVLLLKAHDANWASIGAPPSLPTLSNMVKIPSNLDAVRERLDLGTPLSQLGDRYDVVVQDRTSLMTIRASAGTSQMAADLANTLRDVFLESQGALRRNEAGRQNAWLEARLKDVTAELVEKETALFSFNQEHGLIDLEKELQWNLEELLQVEIQLQAAVSDQRALDMKISHLQGTLVELEQQVQQERRGTSGVIGGIEVGARMQALRQSIEAAQARRLSWAEASAQKQALQRSQELRKEGLISQAEYEQALADYKKSQARTSETGRVREWRQELEDLESLMLSGAAQQTKTLPILQGLLLKAYDYQLELSATEERISHLESHRDQMRAKLETHPQVQRTYLDLRQEVTSTAAEKERLESELFVTRKAHDVDTSDFVVAAAATPPDEPVESNRRLIAVGVVLLSILVGLGIGLALELLDDTVLSEAEAELKIGRPVLGVLPWVPEGPDAGPGGSVDPLLERFKVVASRLRSTLAGTGSRILVVAVGPGEGKSLVTQGLAASFGRMNERVLVVDAQTREEQGDPLAEVIAQQLSPIDEIRVGVTRRAQDLRARVLAGVAAFTGALRERRPFRSWPVFASRVHGIRQAASAWSASVSIHLGASFPTLGLASAQGVGLGWSSPARGEGVGPQPAAASITDLLLADRVAGVGPGLGEYLSTGVGGIADVTRPTRLPGVACIPRLAAPVDPDRIGSERMTTLMAEASARYSVVLVDGPPVLPWVDAEVLARQVDAIVLVVASGRSSVSGIRRALDRLATSRVPVAGIVLNGVTRPFLRDF